MSSLRKIPLNELVKPKVRGVAFVHPEEKLSPRPFVHLAGIVLLLSYSDYGFQFAYQMAIGRLMSVEDYGIYGALASIGTLFALFSGAFPLIVLRNLSRVAADQPELNWPCLNAALRNLSNMLLPFAFLLAVGSPLLKTFFHLPSVLPILLAITAYTLGCYLTTLLVALQALRFYIHNTALTLGFTLVRTMTGVAFVYFLRTNYLGLYSALLLANLLLIALALRLLKSKISRPNPTANFKFSFADVLLR